MVSHATRRSPRIDVSEEVVGGMVSLLFHTVPSWENTQAHIQPRALPIIQRGQLYMVEIVKGECDGADHNVQVSYLVDNPHTVDIWGHGGTLSPQEDALNEK